MCSSYFKPNCEGGDEIKIKEWIKNIRDSVPYRIGTPKRVETFDMATHRLHVKCEKKVGP